MSILFSVNKNMADADKEIQLLKKTKISVFVDEALPDILVVTYEFGVKIFKGVLLDSTKRNLPFGIQTVNPAFKTKPKPDDDSLYAVNQRFAYTAPNANKKKNVQIPSKYKNNKMTVRLRPRQVLCSKCKGICNENSENVSQKRKLSEMIPAPPAKRGINAPITRSVYSELNNKHELGEASLVPKLNRLTPEQELTAFRKLNSIKKNLISPNKENSETEISHSINDHCELSCNSDDLLISQSTSDLNAKRILRKKRSIGSMEDLWDESVFEENINKSKTHHLNPNVISSTSTRTIKISYGPQGEGTILKIPAQIENLNSTTDADSEENVNVEGGGGIKKFVTSKATRKALKRAKKEAKRKVVLPKSSPYYFGNGSPRCSIGGSSPRYTIGNASPRQGLGNNSPRYMYPSQDINIPRRHKRKMKHKKKHREDKSKKHKEGEINIIQKDPREECISQKLSINLKRLNNIYESCPISTDKTETNTSSSSDEHSEQTPDFPPHNPSLMLHVNSQTITSAPIANGGRLLVGDVVWGKIHGFPWWPGKVLTINSYSDHGPQAHVAWYGSSTSSLMQCDQLNPYLEHFKTRFNKKKRGPYKEAVKQATVEAKEKAQVKVRQPLGNSPSHNIIPQIVPPALASPREIDVVS